jgi:hypothetical protein
MARPISYVDLVRPLPVPTPAQTTRFAAHVAGAHSWYKHLPQFPPGERFAFFLEPHAGRRVFYFLDDPLQRPYIGDLGPGDPWHYADYTTADYRRRFGHWSYAHGDGTLAVLVADRDPALSEIPAELVAECACRLTSFVSGRRHPPLMVMAHLMRLQARAFFAYAETNPSDPDVARYLLLARQVSVEARRLSDEVFNGLRHFWKQERRIQRERLVAALRRSRDRFAELLA